MIPENWEKSSDDLIKEVSAPISNPLRSFEFTLDPFQERAVGVAHLGQSVVVSSHTSSGKTIVAEYAIARTLSMQSRVLYTSPIKALSNQKYFELSVQFKDVGLLTGDNTINPNASVIVKTTEILRNMIYNGSSLLKEVQTVIFDEIHYMKDRTRGVVWEESIILLPDAVNFIFLSATISNALEFGKAKEGKTNFQKYLHFILFYST